MVTDTMMFSKLEVKELKRYLLLFTADGVKKFLKLMTLILDGTDSLKVKIWMQLFLSITLKPLWLMMN